MTREAQPLHKGDCLTVAVAHDGEGGPPMLLEQYVHARPPPRRGTVWRVRVEVICIDEMDDDSLVYADFCADTLRAEVDRRLAWAAAAESPDEALARMEGRR